MVQESSPQERSEILHDRLQTSNSIIDLLKSKNLYGYDKISTKIIKLSKPVISSSSSKHKRGVP
jgi:hypothetical protein